jgi:hypothetical protein
MTRRCNNQPEKSCCGVGEGKGSSGGLGDRIGGGGSKVSSGGGNSDGAGCGSKVGGGRPIRFRTYAGIKGKPRFDVVVLSIRRRRPCPPEQCTQEGEEIGVKMLMGLLKTDK